MAKTDRSRFLRQLIDTEKQMDVLFQTLAENISYLVLRAQSDDGTVPISKLSQLQRQAGRLVDEVFIGGQREPYGENNEPQTPFARIITEGQLAGIDVALEREAAILDRYLPEDLRLRMAGREVVV